MAPGGVSTQGQHPHRRVAENFDNTAKVAATQQRIVCVRGVRATIQKKEKKNGTHQIDYDVLPDKPPNYGIPVVCGGVVGEYSLSLSLCIRKSKQSHNILVIVVSRLTER